jgi:hypothetical protein
MAQATPELEFEVRCLSETTIIRSSLLLAPV